MERNGFNQAKSHLTQISQAPAMYQKSPEVGPRHEDGSKRPTKASSQDAFNTVLI